MDISYKSWKHYISERYAKHVESFKDGHQNKNYNASKDTGGGLKGMDEETKS